MARQALELEVKSELLKKRPGQRLLFNPGEADNHEAVRGSHQSQFTLPVAWLARSVYYYQPQAGKPGAKPSQMTMKLDGSWVDNQQIIISIRNLLNVEFNALGYEYIAHDRSAEAVEKGVCHQREKAATARSIG